MAAKRAAETDAAPSGKREAKPAPTRAWVFRMDGTVDVICDARTETEKVVKRFTKILAETSSTPENCWVEFIEFPCYEKGKIKGSWVLIIDENGVHTQRPNAGFASFMEDSSARSAFRGPVAVVRAPMNKDGIADIDRAAALATPPPRPVPEGEETEDEDADYAHNAALTQFFAQLRADWGAVVRASK